MLAEGKKMEVIHFLRKRIAQITNRPEIEQGTNNDDPIKEMGMDSVNMVNLIVQIEQHYDIMFEDEELVIDFFSTIELFASSIAEKLGIKA